MIAVIVPTIKGREESLKRTLASYRYYTVCVVEDSPCAGTGWKRGVEEFVRVHGQPRFVHLTNDDCELEGTLEGAVEAAKAGHIACPVVLNPDGSLQSAGGQLGAPADLLDEIGPDWGEVGFTTVPFLSWEQWEQIGMLDVHYCSDAWVSHRGRQLGYETVLRHDYRIVHHTEQVGRGAGMTQSQRADHDRAIFNRELARA